MAELYQIASKAEYIQDQVRGIKSGLVTEPIPQSLVDNIYRQLCNIADALDEYHSFDQED